MPVYNINIYFNIHINVKKLQSIPSRVITVKITVIVNSDNVRITLTWSDKHTASSFLTKLLFLHVTSFFVLFYCFQTVTHSLRMPAKFGWRPFPRSSVILFREWQYAGADLRLRASSATDHEGLPSLLFLSLPFLSLPSLPLEAGGPGVLPREKFWNSKLL